MIWYLNAMLEDSKVAIYTRIKMYRCFCTQEPHFFMRDQIQSLQNYYKPECNNALWFR